MLDVLIINIILFAVYQVDMLFNDYKSLELKGISSLNKELGHGIYGRVYAVKYCEMICAAKEIHSILFEGMGEAEMHQTIKSFLKECHQCSLLHHPNIVQFLGIYYPPEVGGASQRMKLPVMVMEMMAGSLTAFVDEYEKIPIQIKFSIVHNVSLGLCYLHNHHPPIVHHDLPPNNVLLTAHHVAKISDLGVAKVIQADSRKTMTKAPGTVDFMPPEALDKSPVYGPPMDVLSFGGIILHTFNQQWPSPSSQVQFNPKTRKVVALSEVERRQEYLDKMIGEAEVLRSLVKECLDYDPVVRPSIITVCKKIQVSKDAYTNESLQDVITLHQQVQKYKSKIKLLTDETGLLRSKCELSSQTWSQKEPLKLEEIRQEQQMVSIFINFLHGQIKEYNSSITAIMCQCI